MQSNAQTAPLAAHSVDEFVFSVPDLEEARRFYSSFGLDVRDEDGCLALYTDGHPHRWARILQGECKRLLWVSMGIHAGDMERFAAHLDRLGIARREAPGGADPAGLWIEAPDGLALQLIPGVGHPIHVDGDPRCEKMFEIARDCGYYGNYSRFAVELAAARQSGRKIPLNATGAKGAIVLDMGLTPELGKALTMIGRSVGLMAHIIEEQKNPIAQKVWDMAAGNE